MRPQAARTSPGQGAPAGRPPCCAAGACGRLPAPCTGCKRGANPPLAPALRSCLPRAGPGKAGAAAFGKICAGGGDGRRPPGLRPGRAPRRGAPRCCAAGACGRLSAPCTGCKTRRLPLPYAAACRGQALSPGSAGELANAAVLLQIVRRHSIFGHFSCRTA